MDDGNTWTEMNNLSFLRSGFSRKQNDPVKISNHTHSTKKRSASVTGSSKRIWSHTYSQESSENLLNYSKLREDTSEISSIAATGNQIEFAMKTNAPTSAAERSSSESETEGKVQEGRKKGSPAYEYYTNAGEWWNKFPKTDYTYSFKSPLYGKELTQGVIIKPNMSRRPLRSNSNLDMSTPVSGKSQNDYSASKREHVTRRNRQTLVTQEVHEASSDSLADTYAKYRIHTRATSDETDFRLRTTEQSFVSSVVTFVTSLTIVSMITRFIHYIYEHISKLWRTSDQNSKYSTGQYTYSSYKSYTRTSFDQTNYGNRVSDQSFASRLFWNMATFVKKCVVTIYTYTVLIPLSYVTGSNYRFSRAASAYDASSYYATPTHQRMGLYNNKSWLRILMERFYQAVCRILFLGNSLLVVTSSNGREGKQFKRIFVFLLLPLLLLLGWWYFNSGESVGNLTEAITSALSPLLFFGGNKVAPESHVDNNIISPPPPLHELPVLGMPEFVSSSQSVDMEVFSSAIRQLEELQKFREKVEQRLDIQSSTQEINSQNSKEELNKVEQHLESLNLRVVHVENQWKEKDNTMEFEELKLSVEALRKSLQYLKDRMENQETTSSQYSNIFSEEKLILHKEIEDLKHRNSVLQDQVNHMILTTKRCCDQPPPAIPAAVIHSHVAEYLRNVLVHSGEIGPNEDINIVDWIKNVFVEKHDFESRIANLTAEMQLTVEEAKKKISDFIMTTVSNKIQVELAEQVSYMESAGSGSNYRNVGITMSRVQEMITEAIALYDADKTGMVDFALESAGGSIISTRCTESYQSKTPSVTILGFPVWYESNSPRLVIQPEVLPGKCWSFKGSQGFLVIQLSSLVNITEFTLEHVPRSLIPFGNIESAPKDFSVYGLVTENDKNPILLGDYKYLRNSTSLQRFKVQNKNAPPFEFVELRIKSNNGHMEYTCLYRFRVHGVPVRR